MEAAAEALPAHLEAARAAKVGHTEFLEAVIGGPELRQAVADLSRRLTRSIE